MIPNGADSPTTQRRRRHGATAGHHAPPLRLPPVRGCAGVVALSGSPRRWGVGAVGDLAPLGSRAVVFAVGEFAPSPSPLGSRPVDALRRCAVNGSGEATHQIHVLARTRRTVSPSRRDGDGPPRDIGPHPPSDGTTKVRLFQQSASMSARLRHARDDGPASPIPWTTRDSRPISWRDCFPSLGPPSSACRPARAPAHTSRSSHSRA